MAYLPNKRMNSIILPIHLTVLAFITWNVIIADHLGYKWMRGKVLTLDRNEVKKYHYRVWAGLGFMILTGFFLFLPLQEFFAHTDTILCENGICDNTHHQ